MAQESDFLRALKKNPKDEETRLVFGDWLEENGDPRAPLVRDAEAWEWMKPDAKDPFPLLVEAVSAPGSSKKKKQALGILERVGNGCVVDAIRDWARGDWTERWWDCRFYLEQHPPKKLLSVNKLIRQLRSEVWQEAWLAVIDLGFHPRDEAVKAIPALISLGSQRRQEDLRGCDDDPFRDPIFLLLGNLGERALSAVPLLAGAVWWSEAAYEALVNLGPDPEVVYEHLCFDEDGFARTGMRLLQELDPTGTDMLIKTMRQNSGRAAQAAIQLLGECGSDAAHAIPALMEALQNREAAFRDYERGLIADALVQMGEQAGLAVPVLRSLLGEYKEGGKNRQASFAKERIQRAIAALGG